MHNFFGTTCVVAAFALSTAAAGPDDWARRADVELGKVASTDHSARLSAGDLAVAAYAAKQTDARRETAGRFIRKIADVWVASAKDDSEQSGAQLHAAVLLVEVGDDKGAAEMLSRAAAARSGKAGTAYQSVLDGVTDAVFVKLATGDGHLSPADHPVDGWDLERCFEIAEDVGRPALADRIRAEIRARPFSNVDDEKAAAATFLAQEGHWKEALAAAEDLPDKATRINREKLFASAAGPDVGHEIAKKLRHNYLDSAAGFVTANWDAPDICSVLSMQGDRDGVDLVAKLMPTSGDPILEVRDQCMLASALMQVDEKSECLRHIGLAEAAMSAKPHDLPVNLCLTAAYARAGDAASVQRILDSYEGRTVKAAANQGVYLDSDEGLGQVAEAFVEADLTDDAMKLAEGRGAELKATIACMVAQSFATSGRFADARKLATGLDVDHRITILCFVAREQIRQKSKEDIAVWIDALPTAFERAAVDITVEDAINGYRNRDFERATTGRADVFNTWEFNGGFNPPMPFANAL